MSSQEAYLKDQMETLNHLKKSMETLKKQGDLLFNDALKKVDQNEATKLLELRKKAFELAKKGDNDAAQKLLKDYLDGRKNNR